MVNYSRHKVNWTATAEGGDDDVDLTTSGANFRMALNFAKLKKSSHILRPMRAEMWPQIGVSLELCHLVCVILTILKQTKLVFLVEGPQMCLGSPL